MHISILAGIPEEFKVNIYIGWLFKLIPLIMGLICIALGGFVLESSGQMCRDIKVVSFNLKKTLKL